MEDSSRKRQLEEARERPDFVPHGKLDEGNYPEPKHSDPPQPMQPILPTG